MGTTNFTTLVYASPVRRMYHTGAVCSPNNVDMDRVLRAQQSDLDQLKDQSINLEDVNKKKEVVNSMNLTLKDKLWNNSKKKKIMFDNEEKPSAASTNAGDDDDGLKYRQHTSRGKKNTGKKTNRLNKKTLD